MKTIIIEDERPAARRLCRMLKKLDLDVVTTLHSVEEAVDYLSNHEAPGLIFLDIQLSDGLSFEIFEHVAIDSGIIFTTAYDEYALKAFQLNSIDYLLKPIDQEELKIAVSKYYKHFKQAVTTPATSGKNNWMGALDLQQVAQLLQESHLPYKNRYTARVGERIKLFPVEEIRLFYSENKGTYVHLPNGRNYLIDRKLEQVEQEVDPALYYRISRQALVQIHAITDIIAYSNSRLQVKINSFTEFDLIVSRERVKGFKSWLEGSR